MKNLKNTAAMIAAIAAANPAGFTVNAQTLEPISTGFAVAVLDTQNSFNNEGINRVIEYVNNHPEVNAIGGWYDTESGRYYYDATIVVNTLSEAIELGRINKQLAIFNLNTLEEIRL